MSPVMQHMKAEREEVAEQTLDEERR